MPPPPSLLPAAAPTATRSWVQASGAGVNLTRHFSLACLLGMLVVTICLVSVVRELARQHVVDQGSNANADLAEAFANNVWGHHGDFVLRAPNIPPAELIKDAEFLEIRGHVLDTMRGTSVLKLKIYSLDGRTVFSTDSKQVGESKAENSGFMSAAKGTVASQLIHRDSFDAFERVIADRNLIASYIPVHSRQGSGEVVAVLEIYSDVTDMLARQDRWQWQVAVIVVGLLLMLYAFLYVVVRKADNLIRRQDQERVLREREIWHQAHHDPLTQLPNRSLFAQELAQALKQADDIPGALLYVDLDRFKMVNDAFGHQAGDDVLQAAAARLRECLRAEDHLFRVGGDEFTVLVHRLPSPQVAAQIAARISAVMSRPIDLHDHAVQLGATVGIALFPGDATDADSLVSNANAAMRSAKRASRGDHAFYSQEMNERSRTRLALEAALQRALIDDEFILHYQPRVTTLTRSFCSVEALIRWQRPGHGMVAPGAFIEVLEGMDLMTKVGEWVLRTACTQLRAWHDQGLVHLGLSVNVSARQLAQPDFADVVRRVLIETGVNPGAVELELTESVLIDHTEQARDMLSVLRQKGVKIAIDDFGTGYASLTYLRQLPVDVVKLDRSFVSGVEHNAQDRALSTAIGEMARSLHLTVVAEGVENEAQAAFLASIHCTEMQGFLFSRPESAERLTNTLAKEVFLAESADAELDTEFNTAWPTTSLAVLNPA